jgi:hypothetical protein
MTEALSARAALEWDLRQEVEAGEEGCPDEVALLLRVALGDDRALPLLEALAGKDGNWRAAAIEQLRALTAGRPAPAHERALVEELLEGPGVSEPDLAMALRAGPDVARAAAACRIRVTDSATLERRLCERLALPGVPPWLRRTLLRTLAIVGGEDCFPTLRPLLASDCLLTARTAVGVVVAIGSPLGTGLLAKLLRDGGTRVPDDVARALSLLNVPQEGEAGSSPEGGASPSAQAAVVEATDAEVE